MFTAVRHQPVRAMLAVHCAVCASALGWEHWVTGASRGFVLEWLWPFVFAAAAIACLGYLARPTSDVWWQRSGALLILAYGSRAAAVATRALSDEWTAAAVIGVATWGTLAFVIYLGWLRFVHPPRED